MRPIAMAAVVGLVSAACANQTPRNPIVAPRSANGAAPLAASWSGAWLGTLHENGVVGRLQVRLDLSRNPARCAIDSVDQGAFGVSCRIVATSPSLTIEVPAAHATFSGDLSADGSAIRGRWAEENTSVALDLAREVAPLEAPARAPIAALTFSNETERLPRPLLRSGPSDPYLAKLRATYGLSELVGGARSDYERVRIVSRWVRSRWSHNGDNEPKKSDPIAILEEAQTGKSFRCVEYAIVLAAALTAIGVPAREVGLKMRGAGEMESGAGHVVAEAWLADVGTWVMVDGQFDVIPTARGRPLSAVELQAALARGDDALAVDSFSGASADEYFAWVAPYLYYFSTPFDARYGTEKSPGELFLYPSDAPVLTLFQRKWPIRDAVFTHAVRTFYAAP